MWHTRIVVTAELGDRVDGAIGVTDDLAQPVGPERDGGAPWGSRQSTVSPAGDVGLVTTSIEEYVHFRREPPAPGLPEPPVLRSKGPPPGYATGELTEMKRRFEAERPSSTFGKAGKPKVMVGSDCPQTRYRDFRFGKMMLIRLNVLEHARRIVSRSFDFAVCRVDLV